MIKILGVNSYILESENLFLTLMSPPTLSPAFAPQGGVSSRQASGERGRSVRLATEVRGKFQIFLARFKTVMFDNCMAL